MDGFAKRFPVILNFTFGTGRCRIFLQVEVSHTSELLCFDSHIKPLIEYLVCAVFKHILTKVSRLEVSYPLPIESVVVIFPASLSSQLYDGNTVLQHMLSCAIFLERDLPSNHNSVALCVYHGGFALSARSCNALHLPVVCDVMEIRQLSPPPTSPTSLGQLERWAADAQSITGKILPSASAADITIPGTLHRCRQVCSYMSTRLLFR